MAAAAPIYGLVVGAPGGPPGGVPPPARLAPLAAPLLRNHMPYLAHPSITTNHD